MALSSDDAEHRANLLIGARRYREAIALLADALATGQTARMWCCLALAHWRLGNAEETLQAAEQAIALNPELEWGHRLRGIGLGGLGRIPEGLESLRRSTELAPHWWHAWTDLAELALTARELDEARAAAKRGLELAPEEWWALQVAMAVYWGTNQFDLAERFAERLLLIQPDNARALNTLAWAHKRRGNYEGALPIFEHALAADPTNRGMLGNVIDTLDALERYDEVIEYANRMIDLAPTMPAGWCAIASARLMQRRHREAAEAAETAIAADPEYEHAYRLAALAAWAVCDETSAMSLIRKATDVYRRATVRQRPWLVRSTLAAQLGLMSEAEDCLAKAAELDPTTVGYHLAVVEVAVCAIDSERARVAAQAALDRDPTALKAQLAAGRAAAFDEDWDRAANCFAEVRTLHSQNCCGRAGLLLCQLGLSGRTPAADAELDQLPEFTHDCRCTLVDQIERWAASSG